MTDLQAAEMARRRLDRLARLSAQYGAELNERGVKLLRHAAFEAFVCLRDLEGAEAARAFDPLGDA